MKSHFLIAAPASNSGKTTITLGITRLLTDQGLKVQTFKCGPDFIDTRFLSRASGRPCINLDTFMMSGEHVKHLYAKYNADADVCIIEGVMGLFDGADRMKGSSAEIAKLLNVSVLLVINAQASAYSVAPILYGFKNFDPMLRLAGVIFNKVNTPSHYSFLKDAADDVDVSSLGYVPVNDSIRLKSRHLGLATEDDNEASIKSIADHIAQTLDVAALLNVFKEDLPVYQQAPVEAPTSFKKQVIAVAQDEAFNFAYHENLERLGEAGEVIFFSPLHDKVLPAADVVYLVGGYPELHLEQLEANQSMKQSVLDFCVSGGKVLAECGGLMYLGKEITDAVGKSFQMVGFLDLETSMQQAKLTLGYRKVIYHDKVYKGHEFHYSILKERTSLPFIGRAVNAKGVEVPMRVYKVNNVTASYMHFYWGEGDVPDIWS